MTASRAERPGVAARRLAAEACLRIERDGAYANLVVPDLLGRSPLADRDRNFVTELVYGSTRMRRACDFLVDRFTVRAPDPEARVWLRLGAYQLVFTDVPAHAAVSATLDAAPRRMRGFLNAVLRKVATAPVDWPNDATELSYPDWIVEQLTEDLGGVAARGALEVMNERPEVTRRADGYVQDRASQWVADLVDAAPGSLVFDAAAAPGGKATAIATVGATVVAADRRPARARRVEANAAQLDLPSVLPLVADARRPPLRRAVFDRVLLDAPCSGLGTLRRRPDARWRIGPDDVGRLAALQREMVDALVPMLRPGGVLVYSVCTLTRAETTEIDDHLARQHPALTPLPAPREPWQPCGRGARLLPQTAGTDGMYLLRLQAPRAGHR